MSRQANPTLIGAFVLGAVILGAMTVMVLAGGQWFEERRQHILYFEGAAQGLQVGAPVVFLGVKVGTVKRIQLGLDADNRRFLVPVTIEVEPNAVQSAKGEQVDLRDRQTIRKLVDQGLRGQLRMQSLLTGQLYVDLNFHPGRPARFVAGDPELSEIPTIPPAVEELAAKLEGFPIEAFLADLAEISRSLKKALAAPEAKEIPARLAASLKHLQAVSARLDRESGPVLAAAREDLLAMGKALEAAQAAFVRVEQAAQGAPQALRGLEKAGGELARAAENVQRLSTDEAPTVARLNEALREISRAARALRLLAETLEQQPESMWRGKNPGGEGK